MTSKKIEQQSYDYMIVERAIRYLEDNFKSQPDLDTIAANVNLSKYHFSRIFKRWAGISPIKFLHFLTLQYTKERLSQSKSVLDTAYDAGLSGSSRLHDLFISFEAMTPGDFKRLGSGITISYSIIPTPFGNCLIGSTTKGICHLSFEKEGNFLGSLQKIRDKWPKAELVQDQSDVSSMVNVFFKNDSQQEDKSLKILVRGTNFQTKVWQALLHIPPGTIASYQDIANFIGHPKAHRATASAIAQNPVAYLIPCHRVITKSGHIHRYEYGSARKKAMIGWEASRQSVAL